MRGKAFSLFLRKIIGIVIGKETRLLFQWVTAMCTISTFHRLGSNTRLMLRIAFLFFKIKTKLTKSIEYIGRDKKVTVLGILLTNMTSAKLAEEGSFELKELLN